MRAPVCRARACAAAGWPGTRVPSAQVPSAMPTGRASRPPPICDAARCFGTPGVGLSRTPRRGGRVRRRRASQARARARCTPDAHPATRPFAMPLVPLEPPGWDLRGCHSWVVGWASVARPRPALGRAAPLRPSAAVVCGASVPAAGPACAGLPSPRSARPCAVAGWPGIRVPSAQVPSPLHTGRASLHPPVCNAARSFGTPGVGLAGMPPRGGRGILCRTAEARPLARCGRARSPAPPTNLQRRSVLRNPRGWDCRDAPSGCWGSPLPRAGGSAGDSGPRCPGPDRHAHGMRIPAPARLQCRSILWNPRGGTCRDAPSGW